MYDYKEIVEFRSCNSGCGTSNWCMCDLAKNMADEIERLREALRLGVDARAAQRAYFKDRSQNNLVASKQAEAAFDRASRAALGEKE